MKLFPLLFFACSFQSLHSTCKAQERTAKPQDRHLLFENVPDFSGVSLRGSLLNNESIKGKVTLINFWYIGCPPCMKEIKFLNKLNREFSNQDFKLISIAPQYKNDLISFTNSNSEKFRRIIHADSIEYEIIASCGEKENGEYTIYDDGMKSGCDLVIQRECDLITKDFFVNSYPTTFIINKHGIIKYIESGFAIDDEYGETKYLKLRQIIRDMLNE